MIQLNLLPEVKLRYIKAERLKHTVLTVSIVASIAALVIFLFLLLTVDVWQKKTISDLSGDITVKSRELKNKPDLDKVLTIQSQLSSLDKLHAEKQVSSRLAGYVAQVTPATATISDLKVDFTQNTIAISGNAPSLDVVNTFVDSLKFTKYTTSDDTAEQVAFSSVVLTQFDRDATSASYTINLSYEPAIFSNDNEVTLVVPNKITTRSVTEQPASIFKGSE